MFISPTAAPKSVTIPIIVAARVTNLRFLRSIFTILSLFEILKSDSSFGLRLRTVLKIASASPVITSRLTGFIGIIVMAKVISGREKYSRAVVIGIKHTRSGLPIPDPLLFKTPET